MRPKSTTLPEHNVGIATPSPGPLQNGPLSTTSHLEKNESFTKVRTHVPRKAKRKLGTFKTKVCPTPIVVGDVGDLCGRTGALPVRMPC